MQKMAFLKRRISPDSLAIILRILCAAPKSSAFSPSNKYLVNKNCRCALLHETQGVTILVLSVCVGHELRLDENEVCFSFKSEVNESFSTCPTVAMPLKDIVPEWICSHPSRSWVCSAGLRQLPRKIMENSVILLE